MSFRSPQLKRGSLVAYRRFGNGNHPAGLNFGDRFAYALAKERKLPLLFKGDDFARTDLRPGTVIQRCRSETNPSFQRSA